MTVATESKQEKLNDVESVVEFCRVNHLPAVRVGDWVWCKWPEGEIPDLETREKMKSVGFFYQWKRKEWGHNCGHPSRKGKGDPREKYGEEEI